jgi:hypothetical protein
MNESCVISDPLEIGVELPLRAHFHPKGFPVEIATNSSQVLEAAAESWSCFQSGFEQPQVRLRILIHGDGSTVAGEPVVKAQEHLFIQVADGNNFSVCDMARGFGFCRLSAATAAHADYLRYHFLEGTAYSILEYLWLTSIHAACVARQGRAVLLFGESGAGKSCLAFACAKRGWTLVAEDGTALVRGRDDNLVVGDPYGLRFLASAVALFPELAGQPLSITRGGERTIGVRAASLPIATAWSARAERIVFLRRQDGRAAAEVIPISQSDALAKLEAELPLYGERVRQQQVASLRNLLRQPAWEMRYGELEPAVDRLGGLIEEA